MRHQDPGGKLQIKVMRALEDCLLSVVVQKDVLEGVADLVVGKLREDTWFIHDGQVHEVEEVWPQDADDGHKTYDVIVRDEASEL